MKKLPVIFVIILALVSLFGCQTVKGLGKDIETVGEKMQEKSRR